MYICKGEKEVSNEFMLGEILTTLKTHQGNEIDTNVGRNVGLTESEQQVLELIAENNRLTIKEVALLLSISQRQAERLFASLKSKGVLSRQGSTKNGFWIINI
ncbi:MAG: helix-turn-helix domain-containing protein [Bacteroidales bacterium]|nr:helix-turn-helix domain-containing protein [Bacteroidales bacterium]